MRFCSVIFVKFVAHVDAALDSCLDMLYNLGSDSWLSSLIS